VNVLYGGRIVERGERHKLFAHAGHPYTNGLLGSIPRLDAPRGGRLDAIPGSVADNLPWTSSCAFAPRCPRVLDRCREETPVWEEHPATGLRCFNPAEVDHG
jgi:peptide/nickel transport system ATP-binding protein